MMLLLGWLGLCIVNDSVILILFFLTQGVKFYYTLLTIFYFLLPMKSIKRDRTISNYASVKHPTKQHCPEDLSCGACCRCVERLMKQNKILLDKVQNWGREKEMLEKEILRLRK